MYIRMFKGKSDLTFERLESVPPPAAPPRARGARRPRAGWPAPGAGGRGRGAGGLGDRWS